ncbi:MAG: class I SAM-dependent methyltransferase [Fimbriimonadaceae bacterium]|nr:class I SAM-dependent methyltransferase [Fimbriimonadaceae bacterium]
MNLNPNDPISMWESSAQAWIDSQGEAGDWIRRWVLDKAMKDALPPVDQARSVLDVGCGEGRFCRQLQALGYEATGIDPIESFIQSARTQDPAGRYLVESVESLSFPAESFDLVISYLTLLDFTDLDQAMDEMVRVLRPGGWLLSCTLNPFMTSIEYPWKRDENGDKLYAMVDRYSEERLQVVGWKGIEIINYHRPLRQYMQAFLSRGMILECFDEPDPLPEAPDRDDYLRAPWSILMKWRKG